MALIGNYSVLTKSPAKWLAGTSTAGSNQAQCRSNWNRSSDWRKFGMQDQSDASTSGTAYKYAALPNGYYPPYTWALPVKAGNIVSYKNIATGGNVTAANLAGGLNGVSAIVGTGEINLAAITFLIAAAAALTAAADLAGDIFGKIPANADITAAGDATASINAIAVLVSELNGISILGSDLNAVINAVAPIIGSGDINSASMDLVVNAVAALVGSATVSAAILGRFEAAADLAGSGDTAGAINALANLTTELVGNATLASTLIAKAFMSGEISVAGELITTTNIGQSVWNTILDSDYTAEELMKLISAVLAGKSSSTGSTVVFRDLADTKDRIVATVDTGGVRTGVVKNVT